MKKYALVTLSLIRLTFGGHAYSQNLVINPSFEDTVACPSGGSQLYAVGWYQPTAGTPDYYNSCCSNSIAGVPQNKYGWESAKSGIAYAGVFTYIKGNANYREYVQAKLTDTLTVGLRYYVSFYVSLADACAYACHNFGAYFSATAITSTTVAPLPFIPQVVNALSNPLTNKAGWSKIDGTLVATGNELYITIASFDDDAASDTVFVGGSPPYTHAYYYIDDVSVYTNDSLNTLGVNENNLLDKISIFPNPSKGIVNIRSEKLNLEVNEVKIVNIWGKPVYNSTTSNISEIDLGNVVNGIYFLQLKTDVGISTKKLLSRSNFEKIPSSYSNRFGGVGACSKSCTQPKL